METIWSFTGAFTELFELAIAAQLEGSMLLQATRCIPILWHSLTSILAQNMSKTFCFLARIA
jgi:hypothetical protein